jgi:hypothetical protein
MLATAETYCKRLQERHCPHAYRSVSDRVRVGSAAARRLPSDCGKDLSKRCRAATSDDLPRMRHFTGHALGINDFGASRGQYVERGKLDVRSVDHGVRAHGAERPQPLREDSSEHEDRQIETSAIQGL